MESNIHVIQTDKPSKLIKNNLGYGIVSDAWKQFDINLIQAQFQNIYITDNSEIREGDWVYHKLLKSVFKIDLKEVCQEYIEERRNILKVILTTNQDLIADGVQAIDDEFLEWFVKNPSCEYVQTLWTIPSYRIEKEYRIQIPKEEPKLMNNCHKCGLDLVEREGSKPVCTRIDCGGIILSNETLKEWALKEESKQETIEKAAINYAHNYFNMHETNNYQALKQGFENGAKSDAAKDYWYKKFWEDYESQFKNQNNER